MELVAQVLKITTGGRRVAILGEDTAIVLGVHSSDRIQIKFGSRQIIAIANIAKDFPKNHIGLYEEIAEILGLKVNEKVKVQLAHIPESLRHVRAKVRGERLREHDMTTIVNDVLERPDGAKTRHEINKDRTKQDISCVHLEKPSFVLTVDGEIRPCCFMADDDYKTNFKIHLRQDVKHPQHLINYLRDPKSINLHFHSFVEIMESRYFMWIRKNYKHLYRCNQKCRASFKDIVDEEELC